MHCKKSRFGTPVRLAKCGCFVILRSCIINLLARSFLKLFPTSLLFPSVDHECAARPCIELKTAVNLDRSLRWYNETNFCATVMAVCQSVSWNLPFLNTSTRAGFSWCEALGLSTCEAPFPLLRGKNGEADNDDIDALKVPLINNYKSLRVLHDNCACCCFLHKSVQ